MDYKDLKERIEKIEKEADKIIPNRSYNIMDMTKFEEYLERNAGVDPDAGNRREDFKEFIKPQLEEMKAESIKLTSRLEVFESQAGDLDFTDEKREKYNENVIIQSIVNAYTGGLSFIANNLITAYEERQKLIIEANEVMAELEEINDKIFTNERIAVTHDGSEELEAKRDELLEKLNNTKDGLLTRINKQTTQINKIIRENNLNKRRCLLHNEDMAHALKMRELAEEKDNEKKPEDEKEPEKPEEDIEPKEPEEEIEPKKPEDGVVPKKPVDTKTDDKKKRKLKVVSKKVWDWAHKHPVLATIALGLALTSSVPVVSSGLMMINSSLWAAIGGKGALASILHSINLGLSKIAGLGMFGYDAAAGTYNLAGIAGARALYSAVGAKLTTAALGLGLIGKKVANKINKRKEKEIIEEKEPEVKIDSEPVIDEKDKEVVEVTEYTPTTGAPRPEEEIIEVKPEEVEEEKPVEEKSEPEKGEEQVTLTKKQLAELIKEQVDLSNKPLLEEIEALKNELAIYEEQDRERSI